MSESTQDKPKLALTYNAISIANAERVSGISFFDAFQRMSSAMSMSDAVFLLRAGGVTDDQINEHLTFGAMGECFEQILVGLNDSGFLGVEMEIDEAIKDLRTVGDKLKNINSSETTGKASKQTPTPSDSTTTNSGASPK
jgi:hypothetical protein